MPEEAPSSVSKDCPIQRAIFARRVATGQTNPIGDTSRKWIKSVGGQTRWIQEWLELLEPRVDWRQEARGKWISIGDTGRQSRETDSPCLSDDRFISDRCLQSTIHPAHIPDSGSVGTVTSGTADPSAYCVGAAIMVACYIEHLNIEDIEDLQIYLKNSTEYFESVNYNVNGR